MPKSNAPYEHVDGAPSRPSHYADGSARALDDRHGRPQAAPGENRSRRAVVRLGSAAWPT